MTELAEGARLEIVCAVKSGAVGSNPTLSARNFAVQNLLLAEALAKVFFCGSTSSPRTEKLNNFNLSPFTLSLSKGKLRTFARSSSASQNLRSLNLHHRLILAEHSPEYVADFPKGA